MAQKNKAGLRHFITENKSLFYPLVLMWRLIRLPYRVVHKLILKLDAVERMLSEDKVHVVEEPPYTSGSKAGSRDENYVVEFRKVFSDKTLIRERQRRYLPFIKDTYRPSEIGGSFFLDISCGRGDFLNLLKEMGVKARGLEENEVFRKRLKAEGFDVEGTDPNTFLEKAEDGSITGISAFHFTEHYEPAYIHRFLALARDKIAPGGLILLECPNPKSSVSACNFYFDSTHVWPYPPETLKFMAEWAGFKGIKTLYTCPTSPKFRVEGAEECNYEDYAILAWKDDK